MKYTYFKCCQTNPHFEKTKNGVIDVYNMKTGETISQLKSGEKYYVHKMKIFPLGKKGEWLYIDTEKVINFSGDFDQKQQVIYFKDILGNEILTIKSVDCNVEYNYFLIHVCYVSGEIENSKYIERATIILRYQHNKFDIKTDRIFKSFPLTKSQKHVTMECKSE